MFNDLNAQNKQNQEAVDDIFAETDKLPGGAATSNTAGAPISNTAGQAMPNVEVETQRVGLNADEMGGDEMEKPGSNRWFKVILIVIIAAILLLSGYLAYSKFFRSSEEIVNLPTPNSSKTSSETNSQTPSNNQVGSSVPLTGEENNIATSSAEESQIPGVNAPVVVATTTIPSSSTTTTISVATATPSTLIDSDNDGLTDAEEKLAGTNINVIDTDNDGLSDYEEVKIYHTNPLNADTDGDGYLDGAEVKGGYNPNGPGKMTPTAPSSKK